MQEFHENDNEFFPDKFLDDSFGMGLEFSRLIQNTSNSGLQFGQIIDDKQDIAITESLLKNLQQ